MATRIEPTTEQLQAAWLARRRRNWPPTLEEAMADPVYGALVRMGAVRKVLAERKAPQPAANSPAAAQPATSKRPPSLWPPRRPAADAIDRKRAAAGDRDDD